MSVGSEDDRRRIEDDLIEKIRQLPPDKLEALADFIESLQRRGDDRDSTRDWTRLSEPSFDRVWDNPDDADYDKA